MSAYGLIGAGIGLGVAILGNLYVYPFVVKMRHERFAAKRASMPIEQSEKRETMIKNMLLFQYRVVMPILFSVVGYIFGTQLLGAN